MSTDVANIVTTWCAEAGVEWDVDGRTVTVVLPGEQKLRTTVSYAISSHSVTINAFVMRCPTENSDDIHRWLLRRNTKIFGLAYALDHYGDIFLVGNLPLEAFTHDTVDQLMGSVLEHADMVFNELLEMGFASSIRAEWEWRLRHGESTRNLDAFRHLAPDGFAPQSTSNDNTGQDGTHD